MEGKEKAEHLLALKVMRLTRPTLCCPVIVTSDSRDLPNNLLNNDLKQDITAVPSVETLISGQFMLLPQSFGNIYLGETFSSCICVHNDSNQIAKHVSLKADLQTSTQRLLLSSTSEPQTVELHPQQTLDDVIHHEVTEVGVHILVCEVSYVTTANIRLSFRKFFKFQVLEPLDVKTKFYNAESDEVYLEAQVQNITSGPICLEKVTLESSHLFSVTALNSAVSGESIFGHVNVLQPHASRQFLYCLAPQAALTSDLRLLSGATNVGKLDIVWRSNLGGRGRLQTSQLQRMAPDYGDIRLSIQEIPNIVYLEEVFVIVFKVINTCERSVDLVLELEHSNNSGLVWSGVSGKQQSKIEPGASLLFKLNLIPIEAGLQNVSGVRFTDTFLKRTYEYDDFAQVFVMQKNNK
ncbi:hypothetical protein R5R35_008552 [Gryllus longicercus]|uniref:Trafficking protein particle complex subunit 13 n=1 Tax=Gryllus longicercus TaxID=2509291 RepID=A0AAN9Z8S1_9ORTH